MQPYLSCEMRRASYRDQPSAGLSQSCDGLACFCEAVRILVAFTTTAFTLWYMQQRSQLFFYTEITFYHISHVRTDGYLGRLIQVLFALSPHYCRLKSS